MANTTGSLRGNEIQSLDKWYTELLVIRAWHGA